MNIQKQHARYLSHLVLILLCTATSYAEAPDGTAQGPVASRVRATSNEEIKAMTAELNDMKQQLRESESTDRKTGVVTDSELADRVLKREAILAKQRSISAARRSIDAVSPAATERKILQDKLAAAKSSEERALLIDRHVALKQSIATATNSEAKK